MPVKSARRESRHLIALLFRFFRIDSNKILHATPLFHSQWTLKKKSKSGQYVYLFTYSCSWLWHKIDKIDKKTLGEGGIFLPGGWRVNKCPPLNVTSGESRFTKVGWGKLKKENIHPWEHHFSFIYWTQHKPDIIFLSLSMGLIIRKVDFTKWILNLHLFKMFIIKLEVY